MKAVKNLFVLNIFLLLASTTFAVDKVTPTFPDIQGDYICKGVDPFGDGNSNYINYFSIKKTGATYSFEWVDKNGYPTAYGTGIFNNNLQNTIAVAYLNVFDKTNTGIVFYKISTDGSLQGRWTIKANSKVGTDNCKKK